VAKTTLFSPLRSGRKGVGRRYPYLKGYIKGKPLHLAYFLCYPDAVKPAENEFNPGPWDQRQKSGSEAV